MHIARSSVVLRGPIGPPPSTGTRGWRAQHIALTAVSASALSLWAAQQHRLPDLKGSAKRHGARRKRLPLSWLAVDAVSGAVGEVASLVALYPLDSLKVLCQARGAPAAAVLADLRRSGRPAAALRSLYAGCGSAALCSAAIGAAYLLTFYSARRLGAALLAKQQQRCRGAQQQPGSSGSGSSGSGLQAAGSSADGASALVASAAGVAASLAGSLLEAPMEMFKLRTQAGALQGPMLSSMLREASTRGLSSLYATYGAFMLKSIPYDVAELATYSTLCDARDAAAAQPASDAGAGWRRSAGTALAALPPSSGDMLIGALAGAASVLVSMPCDVIKTRMDLCPAGASSSGGALRSVAAFAATGRALLAAGGPGALFVGVAPRLLQTIPSCMVYWAAVEGTRRFMLRNFDVEAPPAPLAAPQAAPPAGPASPTAASASSPALNRNSSTPALSSTGPLSSSSSSSSRSSSSSSRSSGSVPRPRPPAVPLPVAPAPVLA